MKNKFIILIIIIFVSIISFIIFNSLNQKIDRNSYVVLIDGKGMLNNNLLTKDNKKELSIGDVVRTVGESSLAVLEWGDGSVTRLGGNTSIEIDELNLTQDLSKFNIAFNLKSGKSWSNIVSFLGEGSYFKEYFRDSEAAVRGTIFNVDLSNDYLYVTDHKVTLTSSDGDIIEVEEDKPLNLSNFNFIDLNEFIKTIKDKAWEDLNRGYDAEFFSALKEKADKDLENILKAINLDLENINLNTSKGLEKYDNILSSYQKLNFVKPENTDLFKAKIELKNKLISLSNDENKTKLVESTLYDYQDIINSKDYEKLNYILPVLEENKQILEKLDIRKYINTDVVPSDLKDSFKENFNKLEDIFGVSILDIKETNINDIPDKAKDFIHDSLDNILEESTNLINK